MKLVPSPGKSHPLLPPSSDSMDWTENLALSGVGEVGLEEHKLGASSEASPFGPVTVGAGRGDSITTAHFPPEVVSCPDMLINKSRHSIPECTAAGAWVLACLAGSRHIPREGGEDLGCKPCPREPGPAAWRGFRGSTWSFLS